MQIVSFQTFDETEKRHWECMENEWEREKQKILNALLGSGQDTIDFQPETEVRHSVVYSPSGLKLTLCMLGNFASVFVVCGFFFQINFFIKSLL